MEGKDLLIKLSFQESTGRETFKNKVKRKHHMSSKELEVEKLLSLVDLEHDDLFFF